MKKIGIFYGTTSGKTESIADEVDFNLKKYEREVFNVVDGVEKIKDFENLVFLTPTYGVGELQKDWEEKIEELKNIDFTGKTVGLIGLGNQFTFGESFVDSIRILYDIVIKNNGKIVGFTLNEGYKHQETTAIIDDKFVGLALDENNQDTETPDKVYEWVQEVLKEFK